MIRLIELLDAVTEAVDHPAYSRWRTKRGAWMAKNRWGFKRQFSNPTAAQQYMYSNNSRRKGRPQPIDDPVNRQRKAPDDRADIKKLPE